MEWGNLYGGETPSYARIPGYEFDSGEYWIASPGRVVSKDRVVSTSLDSPEEMTTRQKVRQIWNEIFGTSNIDDNDNFYDLGGHSVLAIQLLAGLNDAFRIEIGMGALLMDPTPANSAKLVEEGLADKEPVEQEKPVHRSHVLPMMFPVQKGDSTRNPLFMVAGLYFNRYYHSEEEGQRKYEQDYFRYFSTLVKNIGPQQPIYGFRPKGIFLNEETHSNVEEMAQAYIGAIKTVQPQGPYLIGGECIGGIIALEMAQQLLRNGDELQHLIIMDTFYPRGKALFIDSLHIARDRIIDELKYPFTRKDIGFLRKTGQFISRLQEFLLPLTQKQRAYRNVNFGNIYYLKKLRNYRPSLFSDPRITILANEEWLSTMSPTLEWKEKYIKHLNIISIPGTHVTRLTDSGHITGRHIRDIIDGE